MSGASSQALSSALSVSYLEPLAEKQTMYSVSDTFDFCLNLGQILSEKELTRIRIKLHSSHPAWRDGSLWEREAELLLLLLLWFVFKHGGHVTVSQVSFAKSRQSVAPESCDANGIESKYFVNWRNWPYVAIRCARIRKTGTRKLCG